MSGGARCARREVVAEPFGHLGEIGSPAVSPRPSQTSLPPSQTIVQPSQAIAKPSASHEGEIVYSLAAALCLLVLCCSQLPWGKPLRRDQAALCLLTLCCSLRKPLTELQSRGSEVQAIKGSTKQNKSR